MTRSRDPVPKNTPPAENDASATKETGPLSTEKIHAPSIGDDMHHAFSCRFVCAIAVELRSRAAALATSREDSTALVGPSHHRIEGIALYKCDRLLIN